MQSKTQPPSPSPDNTLPPPNQDMSGMCNPSIHPPLPPQGQPTPSIGVPPQMCGVCGHLLELQGLGFSEDGQLDYPWCEECVDFTDAVPAGTEHEMYERGTVSFNLSDLFIAVGLTLFAIAIFILVVALIAYAVRMMYGR